MGTHAIAVSLPEGIEPSADDVALLEALCGTIIGLRYPGSHRWEELEGKLENAGWRVHWGLTWFAEARKGGHIESAIGKTRDQALEELWQLTRLDEVDGCP